jgi:hypothetical protein
VASGLTVGSVTGGTFGSLASDYALTSATANSAAASASITTAPVTATLTNTGVSKVYDGSNSTAASATYSVAGQLGTDTVNVATGSLVYNTSHVVGSDHLVASGLTVGSVTGGTFGSLASDYALTSATANSAAASASITTAPLAVTADDQTRPVMTPNPPFTATYSGFQGGDNASSLGGALVFATPATVASPVGAYPITPSGLTSTDYAIAFNDGVLAVTAGTVTPPVSISAFSALSGAIATTINPPGMGATAPSGAEFTNTLAATGGGASSDGSVSVEHISPTILIINCGIRSLAEGCGPR